MEKLANEAGKLGIELSESELGAFEAYRSELLEWNGKFNLTSITDPDEIAMKHFLDSLTVLSALPDDAKAIIDIGSGAGFPGIPLKIARPGLQVTLLEASDKKVSFLTHVIETLGLANIQAVHGRAEDLGRDPQMRERYDAAVSRAVAHMSVLAEYALPFVRVGGVLVAQKVATEDEMRASLDSLEALGGKLRKAMPVMLPGVDLRHLVVVDKVSPTPSKFPRRAGMPSKRPLS